MSQDNSKQNAKKNRFPFKFDISRLPPAFRVMLALILSISIVGGTYSIYQFSFNPSWQSNLNTFIGIKKTDAEQKLINSTIELNNLVQQYNKNGEYFKEYKLSDLDIYPEGWKKRYFIANNEQLNQLISGPQADPDNDGLTNREEFFYGSNPKLNKTLCNNLSLGDKPISTSPFTCDGRNDKQLVDDSISPLTGLTLDVVSKFTVLNQDVAVLNSLKESFEKASDEGVDFPVLYQMSRLIDNSEKMNQIKVIEQPDTAENILNYRDYRLNVINKIISEQEITILSQIYTITKDEQFTNLKKQYQTELDNAQNVAVPKKYVQSHRAFSLMFQILIDLIDHRRSGYLAENTSSQEFKDKSKNLAVEIAWSYRRFQEESANIGE
jgi:hypothetical protein